MPQETYTVASNPSPVTASGGEAPLVHVLFSGESQTKPGHRLGPKVYDFYLMHLVLSGRGTFMLNGSKHELGAGDTFLIQPEELVSYESDPDDPWRYRWIAFAGGMAAELVSAAGFQPGSPIANLPDRRRAAVLYNNIYRTFRNAGASASLQSAGWLQLLMALYRDHRADNAEDSGIRRQENEDIHRQVIHYLSTQYSHPVSIEQMSEALGYNRAYLSRTFKQRAGMSPVSFLLKLRLDKAKLMLRERPELTVEQISASVGLQDALYFSKQFRKQFGQSPTSYRKEMFGGDH
ncbi:AraC family ligand binding domain-containing protein [Paenibacillus sp. LHD-117]|uniref:AraC family ligand binding domain-containing protein n=1 Tax=Paenibacillus sp. LHD-117 TaxID=3071412 RepID=UPI0027DFDBE9|nr:AraC family ligand binding domain-containing protein [Paenibacillus sp. LHD-117]MDQ6420077.1 AraC family ligand binding domain-containing protein [Paenibacillus sp. LHD-117]